MSIASGDRTPPTTFLFIDGDPLRRYFAEAIQAFAGKLDNPLQYLDPDQLRVPYSAQKGFYYDCTNGSKEMEAFLDRIESSDRFHVYRGELIKDAKGKESRQKGVDIRIAVDMLTHAFHRNYSAAVLLACDQDFKPLIEALVNLGVDVTLVYVKGHTSRKLIQAADIARKITWDDWYKFTTQGFRGKYPLPKTSHRGNVTRLEQLSDYHGYKPIFSGSFDGQPGILYEGPPGKSKYILFVNHSSGSALILEHNDQAQLKAHFRLLYGSIEESKP